MATSTPTPADTGYPAKRARTERALVRAAMAVIADRGVEPVTVAAVVRAAGMSQGTFYNYFPSVEALIEATTAQLASALRAGASDLGANATGPEQRIRLGVLQVLSMPRTDEVFARAFVTAIAGIPAFRDQVRVLVRQAIVAGVQAGAFTVPSVEAATDAVFGAVLQALRSRLAGGPSAADPDDHLVGLLLRMLGVP